MLNKFVQIMVVYQEENIDQEFVFQLKQYLKEYVDVIEEEFQIHRRFIIKESKVKGASKLLKIQDPVILHIKDLQEENINLSELGMTIMSKVTDPDINSLVQKL